MHFDRLWPDFVYVLPVWANVHVLPVWANAWPCGASLVKPYRGHIYIYI